MPQSLGRRKVPAGLTPLVGRRDESWNLGMTGWGTQGRGVGRKEGAEGYRWARLAPDLVVDLRRI